MAESITFDPSEVASADRTSLDITPWIQSAGVDWGDAALTAYMSSGQVGSTLVDYTIPNRSITIPLSIRDVGGTTFAAARTAIQAKVGQWQAQGGWIKRVLGSGGTVFCDVVSAQLHLGGDFMQARAQSPADLNASLTIEAIPDFYGAEETLSDHTETTKPELTFTETTTNGGDFPLGDRVRIVVDEDQGQNQRGLFWGIRCRNYSSASTAALAYEAEALNPLDTAAKAAKTGASGGTMVTHGTISTNWTPVLGTNIGGTSYLTHVGTYRVRARVFTTSGTTVQARFVWDVNDLVYPTTNDAVRCYDGGTFHILDLGEIRLDQPPNVTGYRWQGQVQAAGDAGGENFSVDRLWFQPADEYAGPLQAPLALAEGLVTYSARSEFNSESGAITGESLAVGGTWAAGTGSDADDFSASGGLATRSSISDSGTGVTPFQGRFVLAGTTTYSSIATSIDFKFSAANDLVVPAVLLRYTDKDNNVAAWAYNWQETYPELHIRKIVGGAVTELGLAYVTAGPDQFYTLGMMALDNGLWQVVYGPQGSARVVAQGSDSALATGGTLATGKVGFADTNTSATAYTRTYDNFAAWVPPADAVMFASRSLELNTLGITRQDSGGTAYGPVSVVGGDLPRIPNRSSGGTVEFVVKASRGDLERINDPAIDDISARVYRRPSYLLIT